MKLHHLNESTKDKNVKIPKKIKDVRFAEALEAMELDIFKKQKNKKKD